MKMFLTRMGFNSKMVITGDITQIDLPGSKKSGLIQAVDILDKVKGLSFCYFDESDVVRHHLVQRIVRAYGEYTEAQARQMEFPIEEGSAPAKDTSPGDNYAHD
jgi:phosphate starvation-inducible PhoH-like protein